MGRGEARLRALVDLDDNETGNKCNVAGYYRSEVDAGAKHFLLGCVGGLEDEGCLCLKQYSR